MAAAASADTRASDAGVPPVELLPAGQLPSTFVKGFHDEEAVRKMAYRKLDDRFVSCIALGASAFGSVFGKSNDEECAKIVREMVSKGVNIIDTAPWYGDTKSEAVLGKALKGIPREAYYIHTKVCRYKPEVDEMFDFSRERVMASVDESLARLGVEYLDTVQVHDPEFAPSIEIVLKESLPALAEAQKTGKVRRIGITGYPMGVLRELAERSPVPLTTCISYSRFNLHDDSLLSTGTLAFLRSKGLGIINAAPISMGLLTNGSPPDWHPATPEIKAVVAEFASKCSEAGVSLGRLAMAWALSRREVSTIMVSSASIDLWRINLAMAAGESPLSEQEQVLMEEAEATFRAALPPARRHWEDLDVERYWAALGRKLLLRSKYPAYASVGEALVAPAGGGGQAGAKRRRTEDS